jgi:arylformamidase
MPLEKYIGAAQVVTIDRKHGAITPDDVSAIINDSVQRLLIHTWVSDLDDNQWPQDFPYPGVELIDWLADQGAVLLGMDSPSVDDFNSKDLAGHNRLRARGMAHLELLQLRDVPDGVYELVALPLKLWGVCGSPVRAILRG